MSIAAYAVKAVISILIAVAVLAYLHPVGVSDEELMERGRPE